jgi:2-methylcitrate dehydratase PrpD
MAVAEQHDLSGVQLLEAFIVGREVRNSLDKLFLDRNSGVGPGARGWHSNGILGAIAAACSVGNALRLDKPQILHALGLAAGSCGALTRDGGTMAKPFRTGHAAATGMVCAFLAKSGFSADEAALEGRFGLLDALSPIPDAALRELGNGLGIKFHLETGIKSKPLASCTATHSTTEAMLRLASRNSIDAQAVESVECDIKPYPLVRTYPTRGFEGRFSMAFCLAIALIHGRLDQDDFTDAHVSDPRVQAIMKRTKHVPGSTTLVVRLRDGTCLREALAPPANFTSIDEINSKFHRCTEGILTDCNADEAMRTVHDLERASVRQLGKLLRTEIR